jgi:redox-sensing transcriptional repressor
MRLLRYKNALLKLKALNFVRVFSDNLADAAGVTSAQVRKDFSIFGITGNRRGGYKVDDLIEKLSHILGKDKVYEFIIVGIGNIGKALMRYDGFIKSGITIKAGFDTDPEKHDTEAEIPVFDLAELNEFVVKNKIRFGILAIPEFAAQQVFEVMIASGVKGVLNFTPARLKGPEDCVINNINLVTELESLIYFVNVAGKTNGK